MAEVENLNWIELTLLLLAWWVLQAFVLPRFGVAT
jgi:hypothetical protein